MSQVTSVKLQVKSQVIQVKLQVTIYQVLSRYAAMTVPSQNKKWNHIRWIEKYTEWGRFKVPQKAERKHASLFSDTAENCLHNEKAVNEMRMNDVRNDSEWYDQSHVKYQRISWVAEAG